MRINFLRRLKPTRNTITLIGYLSLALQLFGKLMDAVDFFAIMKTAWGFLPNVWQFLTSGAGTLVVTILGLAMIAYGSTRHERARGSRASRYRDIEAEKLGDVLRTMINADNGAPDRCVLVEPKRAHLDHMKDSGGPYLVFEFWVYNASVHSIKFDKPPTGHLIYEKQELKDSLEFLPGGLKPTLQRTNAANIKLRQFLLPEIASSIMDMSDPKAKRKRFFFDLIYLPIETIKPDGDVGNTWKCPLPREVSFDLPADGSVAFPH